MFLADRMYTAVRFVGGPWDIPITPHDTVFQLAWPGCHTCSIPACSRFYSSQKMPCLPCRRDMSGPPERVHDLDDILNEKQSRLSQDEHQGYWERKSAFSSKQADAEASWNALFTQSEAANESQQQTPQRSSPRMREPLASVT